MSPEIEHRQVDLSLGSTTVRCAHHGPRDAELLLVHLHQDEAAARTAGIRLVPAFRGRLVHFDTGDARRLRFEHEGRELEIDPNRIFSAAGIAATLARHNEHVPAGAADAVEAFASDYLELLALERTRAVVALHNTRDDYSVHSYAPGGEEARNAASISIEPAQHRHDFFLVTQLEMFDGLRERGFNTVLQHPLAVDDGSLSVRCKRLGLPYVNVEARFEAVDAQTRMLRVALEVMQLPVSV